MSGQELQINTDSLPSPQTIAHRVFPNDAVGLAYENFNSPSVVVHGWMWVGSIDVPVEQAGLSSLTASMLMRGTAHRTFTQINEEIESVGAALSFGSGGHTTRFTFKCLVEDLPLMLEILTDCLYHPTFPSTYVEKRRGEILTAIRERETNTQAMASLHFRELLYPNHPYGCSTLGYKESIANLTRHDIETFYRDRYGSRGMTAVIVGAVPREQGLDILEEAIGHWEGAEYTQAPLPPIGPIVQTQHRHTAIPGKTQSDIVLGWTGLERQDPDFMKAFVANCVLGQFGMMGRIGKHVREEQGLAYYAYTSLEAGLGAGPWAAIAGVAPENVERAIDSILDQVRQLQREPVGEQELADNKAYIVGSMPLHLEGNEEIAAQIANMKLYRLGLDYLQRFPESIEVLTAEELMQVAQKYMKLDAYALSVAGPSTA